MWIKAGDLVTNDNYALSLYSSSSRIEVIGSIPRNSIGLILEIQKNLMKWIVNGKVGWSCVKLLKVTVSVV